MWKFNGKLSKSHFSWNYGKFNMRRIRFESKVTGKNFWEKGRNWFSALFSVQKSLSAKKSWNEKVLLRIKFSCWISFEKKNVEKFFLWKFFSLQSKKNSTKKSWKKNFSKLFLFFKTIIIRLYLFSRIISQIHDFKSLAWILMKEAFFLISLVKSGFIYLLKVSLLIDILDLRKTSPQKAKFFIKFSSCQGENFNYICI